MLAYVIVVDKRYLIGIVELKGGRFLLLGTEQSRGAAGAIDEVLPRDALVAMLDAQLVAVESVRGAVSEIEVAAHLVAQTLTSGGVLVYVAAGSSGLMGLADGCELPGTFGVAPKQIRICMAGGVPVDGSMPGNTEDDVLAARAVAQSLQPSDLVIALSASGTTPFPCEAARLAADAGVKVVAIANNPDTMLLRLADVAICVETPPEVLAGSTRLGAGTAQKVALNMMSTMAGTLLGHVYGGLMVNLKADNTKLRGRAQNIVMKSADIKRSAAEKALSEAAGDTKTAILIALGAPLLQAQEMLEQHQGQLRICIGEIVNDQTKK